MRKTISQKITSKIRSIVNWFLTKAQNTPIMRMARKRLTAPFKVCVRSLRSPAVSRLRAYHTTA